MSHKHQQGGPKPQVEKSIVEPTAEEVATFGGIEKAAETALEPGMEPEQKTPGVDFAKEAREKAAAEAEANRIEREQLAKEREEFEAQRAELQCQADARQLEEQQAAERAEAEKRLAEHAKSLKASQPRVFEVSIPNSLIGVKRLVAKDEEHAYQLYKASCGMTSHARPQIVVELPTDSPAYLAAVKDWNYARELEAEAAKTAKK